MAINSRRATGNCQKTKQLFCVSHIFQHLEDISLDNDNSFPFTQNASKHAYKLNKTHSAKTHITTNFRI